MSTFVKRRIIAGLVALGVFGLGAAFALLQWARPQGTDNGKPVEIAIRTGSSGSRIADDLERQGVVQSALAFRLYLKTANVQSGLKAGKYELRTGMPFPEVVNELKKGPEIEFVKLVIPEGFTLEQTAAQVEKLTHISASDFIAAATPATASVPGLIPPQVKTLEGLLYPSTYFVEKTETAEGLVRRLVREFNKNYQKLRVADRAQKLGRTPYEIVVIASMIEEEAKADEERGEISAVIHNRLRQNIPLGIDATIQYAVKKYEGQPLTRSDLELDSPYNTRKRAGVPPGPIASPRAGSLEAALDPADVDYIFYVLTADCIHHKFTASGAEFNRAKANQPRNC